MFSRDAIADAQRIVHGVFAPTPQLAWPLLDRRLGATAWVKHENHTPVSSTSTPCAGVSRGAAA